VPTRVDDPGETTDPDSVDYGWIMQMTFVLTILAGAPIVALLSTTVSLPTWEARVSFAVRVGAVVWLCTAAALFAYVRRRQ
jgi:hydrogenase/urease accessory protein HupE